MKLFVVRILAQRNRDGEVIPGGLRYFASRPAANMEANALKNEGLSSQVESCVVDNPRAALVALLNDCWSPHDLHKHRSVVREDSTEVLATFEVEGKR